MAGIRVVRKGGSLPFSFDRGDESIDGWVCTIKVLQFKGDSPAINRVITPTKSVWSGFLTSAETDALTNSTKSSLWFVIAILTNSSTNEEEQIATPSVRFNLVTTWA